MRSISFSHQYVKIPSGPDSLTAQLIGVFRTDFGDLCNQFIEYDTRYISKEGKVEHYPLPTHGPALMLLLKTNDWLWTTVRPWNEGKERYYRDMLNEEVRIIVKEED